MPIILIVDKTGIVKELNVKTYSEDELYKKAGFKTSEGFKLITTWDVNLHENHYFISLYGKTSGRAGQENKYEFPPPIDTTLLFGNCILVNQLECEPVSNLKTSDWDKIYEHLYGGFEDLGEEDSEISEDNDSDLNLPRTSTGYVKDGFIVDDDDDDDDFETEDDTADESDEMEEPVRPVKSAPVPKQSSRKEKSEKVEKTEKKEKSEKKTKKATVFERIDTTIVPPETSAFLDCSSELEEEEYV
jgi:hypothetical protein